MEERNLEDEIMQLIKLKAEGGYWDFKQKWHNNKVDLLHAIICMANNLENSDAYIIIGVEDKNKKIFGISETEESGASATEESAASETKTNRKTQQNLIDFIKDKKFAGDIRPSVYVETLKLEEKEVDVIIIKNSKNTPYYLKESFKEKDKKINAGSIYTRTGDTNTPKNSTADIDKAEYLWKKRFGIDLSPMEKLPLLLKDTKQWYPVGTDGKHSSGNYTGQYYHKQFPEFTLRYYTREERFDKGTK